MPRRDWNTPSAHTQKPRHGHMRSGARGKGHDKKRRACKRGQGVRPRRYPRHRDDELQ